ncbi:hypothetical protein DPMN_014938 [Dreissena polymorpha]|uniref:B box-type domain-containing protein n=1 Tax=Dreissena polymorpha TaxID=45954 RepID=A0A9D4S368_DREPO|nr:hypothetical protein DPMN_014938 [Dreissena polymorpha]
MAEGGSQDLTALREALIPHKRTILSTTVGLLDDVSFRDIHCIWCQRKGRKRKGDYYCQDCKIGLCLSCANAHLDEVKMNRHSVSIISKTFMVSPNQGPFPELTEIGTIKFDVEACIRGSAFLPNGELVITDFTNSRIRVYSADYTRKPLSNLLVPKQNKWDEERPKPVCIAAINANEVAFTANNGCIYIASIGKSMVMQIKRVIPVISFDKNFGECLGLAFNDGDDCLYVGCSSDMEGVYIKVFGLDGELRRIVMENINEAPNFLKFGLNKTKLFAADSDNVKVYGLNDFSVVEDYTELQAQTKDIIVDKWGYLYTLALERRLFKTPGSIYRLNPDSGVTKVTALPDTPSSAAYCEKTDDVAVTFAKSRYVYLYKLKLRTFQKQFGNDLKPYDKTKGKT